MLQNLTQCPCMHGKPCRNHQKDLNISFTSSESKFFKIIIKDYLKLKLELGLKLIVKVLLNAKGKILISIKIIIHFYI